MITPEQAVMYALLACLVGAGATLFLNRAKMAAGWVALVTTAGAAALMLYAVARVIGNGPGQALTFWTWQQFGFALRIHVDGLSATFLVLIAVVAVPAVFYSIPYLAHYRDYGARRYYPYLLLFIAGMIGLVTTTDAMFFFFVFWQMMTLTSYALVRYEHRRPENRRAAWKYLGMMQLACFLTMIGAEILAGGAVTQGNEVLAKYDFDAISHHLPGLLQTKGALVALAFVLFLVGFGIKAGMWPFGQMWLPDAHPAAPSPVSALLSGVMIKTGVYGLMRYFLWLVPAGAQDDFPVAGWGFVIAALGTLTLLTGTLQALRQEQSKRLLAFHSIGQVGYILLGFGASLALLSAAPAAAVALAAVGFYGALFHTLNHGLFKSLLFLNSGSMLWSTGTQDLNRMGGLMKFMPLTAITALIAAFSISGVPLFNGFASKWSIYLATLQGGAQTGYLTFCGVIALLTSALTLASFIKFFGATFLSRTSAVVRDQLRQKKSLEVGWMMLAPQWFLAIACVALGIVPVLAFDFIQSALRASQQGLGRALANALPANTSGWAGIEWSLGTAVFQPLVLLGVLAAMLLLIRTLVKAAGSRRRADTPWLCGYVRETEAARYSAHHFYTDFKKYFGWLGGPPRADDKLPAGTDGALNKVSET